MPRGYRLNTEIVSNRIKEQSNGEYKLISPYVNAKEKVTILHKECGYEWKTKASHFFSGTRCPKCRRSVSSNHEEFLKKFSKLPHSSEYEFKTSYKRTHEKIKVTHITCGSTVEKTPHDLLEGQRCPMCYGNRRKSTNEFRNEVYTETEGSYELLDEYVNSRVKVSIKHNKCGKIYKVTPHDFVSGNRCPFCKQSKGEQLVAQVLDKYGVPYEIQRAFEKLDSGKGRKMPFDFYLPERNLLIEYDGIQHFEAVKYFGGDKKLNDQRRRDLEKTDFANREGIDLLRVSYTKTKDEVDKIITEKLGL